MLCQLCESVDKFTDYYNVRGRAICICKFCLERILTNVCQEVSYELPKLRSTSEDYPFRLRVCSGMPDLREDSL